MRKVLEKALNADIKNSQKEVEDLGKNNFHKLIKL